MRRPSARRRRPRADRAAMTSADPGAACAARLDGTGVAAAPPPRPPRSRRPMRGSAGCAMPPCGWRSPLCLRSATATASSSPIVDRLGGEIVPYAAVTTEDGAVRVRAHRDGHFYIDSRVNGQDVRFLVDTGASVVALSPDDAERIGFDRTRLNYSQRLHTAGGIVRAAPVVIRTLELGDIRLTNVRAVVNGERLPHSLRGISALERTERLRGPGRHADVAAVRPATSPANTCGPSISFIDVPSLNERCRIRRSSFASSNDLAAWTSAGTAALALRRRHLDNFTRNGIPNLGLGQVDLAAIPDHRMEPLSLHRHRHDRNLEPRRCAQRRFPSPCGRGPFRALLVEVDVRIHR